MILSENLLRVSKLDLNPMFVLANPKATPLSTLLYGRNKNYKHNDYKVRGVMKTLSTGTPSGARKQGAAAPAVEASAYNEYDNYLEIFSKAVEISGTVGALYGSADAKIAKEVSDRMTEIKYDIEYAFINGLKGAEDEATGRTMDGLLALAHADNTVTTAVDELSQDDILDCLQAMYGFKMTNGDLWAFANPVVKRLINKLFIDQATNTTINIQAGTAGQAVGLSITSIVTDFGTLNLCMADAVPTTEIVVANVDYIEVPELRPIHFEALAKVGDSDKGQIVTEVGIIAPKSAIGRITINPAEEPVG